MTTEKKLLSVLKTIEGTGSFEISGVKKFLHPGLHIEGIGEIGFPLTPNGVKEIIKKAKKAPFGKGSKTVTDTTVRSAWEIDASMLSFHNEEWLPFFKEILETVKKGLSLEHYEIEASLYKLLIYEKGDFFLPHKDSEKEKGMFATLIISLPSKHKGGELMIRFDGQEEVIDFAPSASSYKIPFAAFYADCEHEVKPVTSGYRVNLVYNLVQTGSSTTLKSPSFTRQVEDMTELLKTMKSSFIGQPKAVLLDHQYTPANFSLNQLKQHDWTRAQLLMDTAENAGYFARLGLVTHYLMGDIEGAGYDDYYIDTEVVSMGTDIYEESSTIEHWSESEGPSLGKVNIEETDLISTIDIGKGDPIKKEAEGYTGNAGMTLEYWYHYGAVILWPKDKHKELLFQQPTDIRLSWLTYYVQNWTNSSLNSKNYTKQLLKGFANEEEVDKTVYGYKQSDYSPIVAAIIQLNEEPFIKTDGQKLLPRIFEDISVDKWIELINHFPPNVFDSIIKKVATTEEVDIINHLLEILNVLKEAKNKQVKAFALAHIQDLPNYLTDVQLSTIKKEQRFYSYTQDTTRRDTIHKIIEKIFLVSATQEKETTWLNQITNILSKKLPRDYVNEVLYPILTDKQFKKYKLTKLMYDICHADFVERTKVQPTPPTTWTRAFPKKIDKYNEAQWELLRNFLASPTQQVFNYAKRQSIRSSLASAIKRVTIDLEMETVRQGSPHTLRITKTQAAYEKELKEWKEDVKLLKKLELSSSS